MCTYLNAHIFVNIFPLQKNMEIMFCTKEMSAFMQMKDDLGSSVCHFHSSNYDKHQHLEHVSMHSRSYFLYNLYSIHRAHIFFAFV